MFAASSTGSTCLRDLDRLGVLVVGIVVDGLHGFCQQILSSQIDVDSCPSLQQILVLAVCASALLQGVAVDLALALLPPPLGGQTRPPP